MQDHIEHARHHVATYLVLFQKLPFEVRCEQAWQMLVYHKNSQWEDMACYMWHTVRVLGGRDLVQFWHIGAPFEEFQKDSGSLPPFSTTIQLN